MKPNPWNCWRGTADTAPIGCTSSTWTARGTAAAATARSSRRSPRSPASTCRWAAACAASRRSQDMLDLGAARAVVGSAALTEPEEVRRWLRHFGNGRIALAFDVRLDEAGTPCVATHGWARQSALPLWEAVAGFIDAGLMHVLCTDVSRDGALSGPNVALYAEAVRRLPQVALAGIRRHPRCTRSARPGRLRCGGRDQRQGAAGGTHPDRGAADHSCQTHNSLPRRARRAGGQGSALPRPPHRRRHPGARRALSRRRRGRARVLRHHREP